MTATVTATLRHPNIRRFSGILAIIDEPSDKSPTGGHGHRVLITMAAVEKCLSTIIGMGVGVHVEYSQHDFRRKCGVITGAEIVGDRIQVEGHLFEKDFPEIVDRLCAGEADEFGLSYEMSECKIQDIRADVWTITDMFFTGVAILKRDRAAYRGTSIRISGEDEDEGDRL